MTLSFDFPNTLCLIEKLCGNKGLNLYLLFYPVNIIIKHTCIVYNYQIEHSAKDISKNVADSIFEAEKINKDY
jgi:hypothetical protein